MRRISFDSLCHLIKWCGEALRSFCAMTDDIDDNDAVHGWLGVTNVAGKVDVCLNRLNGLVDGNGVMNCEVVADVDGISCSDMDELSAVVSALRSALMMASAKCDRRRARYEDRVLDAFNRKGEVSHD